MTERLTKLSRSVDGSTVIVTGAASGMGRATAHLFADEGAKVALIDIDESGLNRVADEVRTVSDSVLCLVVDLSDRLSVERAVSHVIEHYGGLDILVNNAGFATPAAIDSEVFERVWSRSLDVMATAQAWAIRAALPGLRQSDHPRVVNIASTEAYGATRLNSAYVAAKHASDPTYTSLVGDLEIRLPKGPWLFDGEDTGSLSAAVPKGANNREVLYEVGFDDATIKAWEDAGILSADV